MTSSALPQLAHRHCAANKPALNFQGFVHESYGVSRQFLAQVAAGKKKPSAKFLLRLDQAHVRLFPSEPVILLLPNGHPPVVLGDVAKLNSSN